MYIRVKRYSHYKTRLQAYTSCIHKILYNYENKLLTQAQVSLQIEIIEHSKARYPKGIELLKLDLIEF